MFDQPPSSSLNHYTIARALGSSLKSGSGIQFGLLGLRRAHAEWALAFHTSTQTSTQQSDESADQLIVEAADKAKGAAYGRQYVLAFARLRKAFHTLCREAGLGLPEAVLNARLLALSGERIHQRLPFNQSIEVQQNVRRYQRVFEFAASKLRYEYGASLDDVLSEPKLGAEFDTLCSICIQGSLKPDDYRLSALTLRNEHLIDFDSIKINDTLQSRKASDLGILSQLALDAIPHEHGILFLLEHHDSTVNVLFVETTMDASLAADSYLSGNIFRMMAGEYWQPNPATMSLRFLSAETNDPLVLPQTLIQLINTERPVFNVPFIKPH